MEIFRRYGMVLALLVVAVSTGFGCCKKSVDVEQSVAMECIAPTPAINAAAETITDGIIYFDFDKYDIKPEFRDMLQKKAELLKEYPCIRVRIEGNCDARGTQEYNLSLGERRARAAYEYLVMLGVNPSQLEIISFGKERPAVEGTGPAVWAKNRRDDFRIIAK